MHTTFREENYDVVVIGGGSSGISAALSAAQNGARTLLVDAGSALGGELISGINLIGLKSSQGEDIVGGTVTTFFDECKRLGGYIGVVSDFRPIYYVSFDPDIMRVAISSVLDRSGVEIRLYSFASDVVVDNDGFLTGVILVNKLGKTLVRGKVFIDCSGDADLAISAGVPYESGDSKTRDFQSITIVFRMSGVDTPALLDFMRDNPENFAISEEAFSSISVSRQEAIDGLHAQGMPKVSLSAKGPLLAQAIDSGEMYETSIVAIAPISTLRKEVSVNSTKISNIDATDPVALSASYTQLLDQAMTCIRFLNNRLPGFENAHFSGLAPRIGIRETRRIIGKEQLTGEDVRNGRKRTDGIAKGGHPIDVWVDGRGVHWEIVKDGGSYDIPFGCLIPKTLKNLLVAGRCLSSTREGQASSRVIGTCMATGQAAGTAAALLCQKGNIQPDIGELSIEILRNKLQSQGEIL